MATITLQGNEVHTNGDLPSMGNKSPDFLLVNKDLKNIKLNEFYGKKKLLSIVPSLDTPVCAISTKKFSEFAAQRDDVVVLIISADLPFAMSRFCNSESVENVITLSMMRNKDFARDYGILIQDGPLEGISARAVVVLDADNDVIYSELVSEISDEPDYQAALDALA